MYYIRLRGNCKKIAKILTRILIKTWLGPLKIDGETCSYGQTWTIEDVKWENINNTVFSGYSRTIIEVWVRLDEEIKTFIILTAFKILISLFI